MTLCEKSDLPEEYCAHCRGNISVEEQAAMDAKILVSADPRFMLARYPGRCGECGEPFGEADAIRARERGEGPVWIAVCCDAVA